MAPVPLRIPGIVRGARVSFRFDGREVAGHEGEMLAVALLAAGIQTLRHGPGDGGPRGLFCAMGSCQECAVLVDGQRVEACRIAVCAGLEASRVP